jgi:uncharacterized surface protein with fasciclin (FAS1) repeats
MRRQIVSFALAASLVLAAALPATAAPAPKPGDQTIAQIVAGSAAQGEFTLLLGALEHAGLTEVFTGGGQYTVFAPTDAAFVGLVQTLFPDGIPAEYDGDPFAAIDGEVGADTVANVLLYHVAEGRRAANSVVPKRSERTIGTLLGASFTVNPMARISTIAGQDVGIERADLSARNGVIHVIDEVLLPLS